MGQGRSKLKLFNSLSQSLGLSRTDQEQDTAGQALFRVRSGSLDSISTAVSFGTGQHLQARSNSLDNLHQPPPPPPGCGVSSTTPAAAAAQCVEAGQTYTLLAADSSSVASCSASDREVEVVQRKKKNALTQSLPVEVERAVIMQPSSSQSHSHSKKQSDSRVSRSQSMRQRKEVDAFSDNFVAPFESHGTKAKDMPSEKLMCSQGDDVSLPPKSILKGSQELQDAANKLAGIAGLPAIQAPALLEKLTPEDLNDFISYVCATLGHSLHSSLEEKLQQQQNNDDSPTTSATTTSTTKHVRINEDQSADRREVLEQAEAEGGENPVIINKTRSDERVHRRRRRPRRERPNSFPSLWVKPECVEEDDKPREIIEPQCHHHHHECPHHKCSEVVVVEPTLNEGECSPHQHHQHACRQRCQSEPHHRSRRRRTARAKDAPVDVSLDDNCPGVPENRVRRSRHYHHHHAPCDQCFQAETGGKGERRITPKDSEPPPPPLNTTKKEKDSSLIKRNKPGCVLTLEDMKTAALLLQRSAGCIEDDIQARLDTYGQHSSKRHGQRKPKNTKRRHFYSEEVIAATVVSHEPPSKDQVNIPPGGGGGKNTNGTFWNDLVFPPRSRSGRDSPATDMAVANLDLNSSKMREPTVLAVSDSYLNNLPSNDNPNCNDSQTVKHLYLHNHHHFHHIIHHSQP